MKHIKSFNENENAAPAPAPAAAKIDYKGNLSRGENDFVGKVLPELEKSVGAEMKAIVEKIHNLVKSGKLPDSNNDFGRDYGLAIGSMFYNLHNKK